ncbi:MAG: NRDE family protein [Flavobacteriaceae bacterium]
MCTVTYIPTSKNNFILTSSRDVPFAREKALFPKEYLDGDVKITYPKDGKASGTWIGHSSKKRLICLLNGGFKNHYVTGNSKTIYRKSRGLIVLDLLKKHDIYSALNNIDLLEIEPFTLVIVDYASTSSKTNLTDSIIESNTNLQLIEFVWDGKTKHLKKLPQKNYIWSSATLYDAKMKHLREDWFADKKEYTSKSILDFHHKAGNGDSTVAVIMKREKVGTVSITQVCKTNDDILMNYEEIN